MTANTGEIEYAVRIIFRGKYERKVEKMNIRDNVK